LPRRLADAGFEFIPEFSAKLIKENKNDNV